MPAFWLKKIVCCLILWIFSTIGLSVSYEGILAQETRPEVRQVIELCKTWDFPRLKVERTLLIDKFVSEGANLHNNYPVWFDALINNAPKMIATFERSFPGATWAFIGRDMSIFADLFEAFYLSIGQQSRVVRIGMSSGTLEGMTDERALSFLKANKFNEHAEHPYVFVDAISRGGGRQGRTLVQAIYNRLAHTKEDATRLSWYINFIGMKVSTTAIDDNPVDQAYLQLRTIDTNKLFHSRRDVFNVLKIFTYSDGRDSKDDRYLGMNEAGYSHWTGAWHGPYGPLKDRDDGSISASPLPMQLLNVKNYDVEVRKIREAVLLYQAHVIWAARSNDFRARVVAEARDLNYIFPLEHPKYILDPTKKLLEDLEKATTVIEYIKVLKEFNRWNLERTPRKEFTQAVLQRLPHFITLYPTPEEAASWAELAHLNDLSQFCILYLNRASVEHFLQLLAIWKSKNLLAPKYITDNLDIFFAKKPELPQVNYLINLNPRNGALHQIIMIEALKHIDSREEYKRLIRANLRFWVNNPYKTSVKEFKKKHPKASIFKRIGLVK